MNLRKKIQQTPQVESKNSENEEMSLMSRCKTFKVENLRFPQVVTQPNTKFEQKVLKWWLKFCIYGILIAIVLTPFNLMFNATTKEKHELEVQTIQREYDRMVSELYRLKSQKNVIITQLHIEKEYKKKAISTYLERNNASEELKKLVPLCVELSYLYDIDPFRPMSIIILETGYGHSKALHRNKNVAGLNWTDEQKKRIGIKSDVYNLAVEKTIEASLTNLIMLMVDYKNFDTPLVTLSEIQTRYAPSDDPRNGLGGMDNTKWTKNTIYHYNQMDAAYKEVAKQ